jgi:hypothetical protein
VHYDLKIDVDSSDVRCGAKLADLDQLRNELDPLVPTFLLVDPLVGEPLPAIGNAKTEAELRAIRELVWERETINIRLSDSISLPLHQQPYLVHIKGPNDHLLELTLDIAHRERLAAQAGGLDGEGKAAHRIGGWLQSTVRPALLAKILADMCEVNTDAYTKATYFRMVDRRVLGWLKYLVGEERVAKQFGALRSWTFLNPVGGLTRLGSRSDEVEPLRLNAREWHQMERGEILNRTLAQWLGARAQKGDLAHPALKDLYATVEQSLLSLSTATRKWPHRFERMSDETVWAALSLLYPSIAQNRAVLALLDQAGSADEPSEPLRYLHQELSSIVLDERAMLN